jgi:DNA-binding Lrp family transcriptional regulator
MSVQMLSADQLTETDSDILDMLEEESRMTVPWISDEIDSSPEYVRSRLLRLVEHGHVERPYRAVYDLVDNPREIDDE